MSNLIIKIHNVETGEVIEREMNKDELTQYEKDAKATAEANAINASNLAAKNALLEKLGITADEAKLLLS